MAIMLLNAIDAWFIAQLGATELAAVSFTFPVVSLVGSLTLGLGTGATSVISRTLGAGEDQRVRRLTTDSLFLALVIVGALAGLGLATIDPVFTAMGATESTLPFVRDYMEVWYWGMIALVVPMVGNSAVRATGDTRTPAVLMLGAALLNGLLDPLLIFGWGPVPAMGVRGAAIATVIARGVSMLAVLALLVMKYKLITWERPQLTELIGSWRGVLGVGAPAAATNVVGPVAIMVITRVVSEFGEEAVAAFGAGGRVQMLAMIGPLALSIGLAPFMGQNWGAGRKDRVAEGQRLAERAAIIWGFASWVLLALFAEPIARAFAEEPGVVAPLVDFLRVVPLGLAGLGVVFMVCSTFNAIDRPMDSALITVLRALALALPSALLGAKLFGLLGVFGGLVVADAIAGTVAWLWIRGVRSHEPVAA